MTPEAGYLNAHCHLELSHLRGAIPAGLGFVDWLVQIAELKRAHSPEVVAEGVRAGLREMAETGTRAVLDIDSMGVSEPIVRADGIRGLVFKEVLKLDPDRGEAMVTEALRHQEETRRVASEVLQGLSPHAPYSTTVPLLRAAVRAAKENGHWLCVHAAETPEETELMVHGRGRLHELLADMKVLPEGWSAPGMRPLEFLDAQGILGPRTLLVHVNDITDSDVCLIAERCCRAVVCPGSHVYFGRGEFPLGRLLEAGVPTYLGTDSLASNEALDMAREIDLACELAPGVDRGVIEGLAAADRLRDFM